MRDYRAWFLVGFAVILSFNFGLLGYLTYANQQSPYVKFVSLQLTGPSLLCPNEDLIYVTTLDFSKPGQVSLIGTIRHIHITPNEEAIVHLHSIMTEQLQTEQAGSFVMRRYFRLPMTMVDPMSGLSLPWESGKYEWQVTVFSLGKPSGETKQVPFIISATCPRPP